MYGAYGTDSLCMSSSKAFDVHTHLQVNSTLQEMSARSVSHNRFDSYWRRYNGAVVFCFLETQWSTPSQSPNSTSGRSLQTKELFLITRLRLSTLASLDFRADPGMFGAILSREANGQFHLYFTATQSQHISSVMPVQQDASSTYIWGSGVRTKSNSD